jgi:LysE type translocator
MHWETLLPFASAALIVQLVPGPGMLFILANGIAGGPRVGVAAACGAATGMVFHTFAAALGLAALFAKAPAAYDTLRFVGAVPALDGRRTLQGRLARGHRGRPDRRSVAKARFRSRVAQQHRQPQGDPLLPRVLPPVRRARGRIGANFEFEGAIAQLGERLNGIQEVAGSSPASSTQR